MLMLREFASKDLREAFRQTAGLPELLFIHTAVRNMVTVQNTDSNVRVFCYPFTQPVYWFLIHSNTSSRTLVHVAHCGVHEISMFQTALRLFCEKVADNLQQGDFDVAGDALLLHDAPAVLSTQLPSYQLSTRIPHTLFYMGQEQKDKTMKVNISLPYGYDFCALKPTDAETVKNSCETDDSLDIIRQRIEFHPCVSIRNSSSGALVSHELTSTLGNMTHQYTVSEHRRRGLGLAAELRLAQNIIKSDGTPFKAVPNHLTSILLSSEVSPFWTMWTRNAFPVQFVVQRLHKM